MTIEIPDIAFSEELTPDNFLIEFACYLYEKKRFSLNKASKLTNLDVVSFQKELAKRDIYMHYDVEDFEKDLRNLGIAA
jgi:predicted HTH domain antitoxin